VRIAQELHDVVAHNVSLIVVKAQALGATVPDERVAEATDGIADLGRQAMAEMHRTLTLLRTRRATGRRARPQPGLANLDKLLERRARPASTSRSPSRASRAQLPRASTCRPSASSRRR
jgi:signal transduction histidine kinase